MHIWLALLCFGTAPNVTSGPELEDNAEVLAAPIAEVTVFSDRATVRRRARVKLGRNASVRFPDLPGATLVDTIRVESNAGKVLRVEVQAVDRERITLEEVDALLISLEGLADELAKLEAGRAAIEAELASLAELRPEVPPVDKRAPGANLVLSPDTWRPVLELVDARRQADHAELRQLELKRRALLEQHRKVSQELAERNLGGLSQRLLQVLAILETGGGETDLVLEYTVQGARWRPAYELHFEPSKSTVELRSAGLVEQATGEDWPAVRLSASTAIPGQGIDLPRLLTWTLGEKGEFVPQPRAERVPAVAALPAAAPPAARFADIQRSTRAEVVAERLGQVASLAAELLPLAQPTLGGFGSALTLDGEMAHSGKKQLRAMANRRDRPPQAPPPPPIRLAAPMPSAPAEAEPMIDMSGMSIEGDGYETVSVSAAPSSPSGMSFSKSAPSAPPTYRALALREAPGWTQPHFSDQSLPAVLAGGLDYVYPAPTPATVPSNGEALRVPLGAEVFPVRLFYEATPSLAKTAFLRAEVRNPQSQPILAGKVAIFSRGDFLAEAMLKTTGPGANLELPLGADEDIRITYRVVPESRTEGVFGKEEITDYTVTIELGNYKKRDVRIRVWDQIPKTNQEKIKIELLNTKPTTAFGPDAKGLLGWEVDIAAGKTATITMSYRIRRPADWRLRQQ